MKRLWIVGLPIALAFTGLSAPAAQADVRAPLGCYGCSIPYGAKDTWYTKCWGGPVEATLEAKQGGKWVFVAKSKPKKGYRDYGVDGDYTQKKLVCPTELQPWIQRYTFRVDFEGKFMSAGGYAGLERVRMREGWTVTDKKGRNPRTQYRYLTVYVSD